MTTLHPMTQSMIDEHLLDQWCELTGNDVTELGWAGTKLGPRTSMAGMQTATSSIPLVTAT